MTARKDLQRALDLLTEAHTLLDTIKGDREAYAEDRSERWQESEKGEEYLERTSELDEAHTEAEAAATRVEETLDNL